MNRYRNPPRSNLTEMEVKLLRAFMQSDYINSAEDETYVFDVIEKSGIPAKQARGALSSLVQKGIVRIWRDEKWEVIVLTPEGIKMVRQPNPPRSSLAMMRSRPSRLTQSDLRLVRGRRNPWVLRGFEMTAAGIPRSTPSWQSRQMSNQEAKDLMSRMRRGRNPDITAESLRVFLMYAKDAINWSGTPLVGGNVGGSKEERGNLTQLKRAGLITTQVDAGDTWIYFTDMGKELARKYGIDPIYMNPSKRTRRNPDPKSLYQSFHGVAPTRTRKVSLPRPKGSLTVIGRLEQLEYTPYPPSRRAGKRFYHRLGDTGDRMLPNRPVLASDSAGNLYIIPDKARPTFGSRGIVGGLLLGILVAPFLQGIASSLGYLS